MRIGVGPGWLVGRLVGQSVGRWVGRSVGWLVAIHQSSGAVSAAD